MPKHVVAIDDSPVALAVIAEALDHPEIDILTTDTPGEFFRAVFGQPAPDLILTDLEMPNIAGSDICRQLKNDPRTKHIPLVILSTLPAIKLVTTARLLGADKYICKANFSEKDVALTLLPMLGLKPGAEDEESSGV